MRTGTTRARLWLLGGLLLGGIAGCGADEQNILIAETTALLTDVTSKLGEVRGFVKKAVDVSDQTGQRIPATDENLLNAKRAAKEVRKRGERLQRIKEYTDRAKDKTTAEYSKELLTQYRASLQEKLVNLEKEEDALRAVLAQAEERTDNKGGKEELGNLREELKNGRGAFELLIKQR